MQDAAKQAKHIRAKLAGVLPFLNEKQRRVVAAAEAKAYGRGGISVVSRACGLARETIYRGLSDLDSGEVSERVRDPGGGRKKLTQKDPRLGKALEALIEPHTRGDPQSLLRWTCLSVRKLEGELTRAGHPVSYGSIANLLHALGYSLAGNRKSTEGVKDHPDRDAQFRYIDAQARDFLKHREPVISADTKKKELIGNYKNGGREWQPKGYRRTVLTHDFPDPKIPKAVPYGIYDIAENSGWVNVGISADTAEFSVASIRWWWRRMGEKRYPKTKRLLVCVDSGGSNGYRLHLWKRELQRFADASGLAITVCHFPRGTSKWNKVEHRLFSYISLNWRGRPLTDYRTVVNLIAATTTTTGLTVKARLDRTIYRTGIEVSAQELKTLSLRAHDFHGEWNYTISPRL